MTDALRLAVGTLTVLRVPAPRTVDRRVGGRAMVLAPLVGLLLGLLAAGTGALGDLAGLGPLPCAVLVVSALALLTRGIHLDGLADTADGLGSGRRGADALAVMSKSDIGPFGVVTLVLVLLVDVTVLAQLWADGHGPASVVIAAVASRAVLPLLCRTSVPAAKESGLGAVVASSVRGRMLVGSLLVAAIAVTVAGAIDRGFGDGTVVLGQAIVCVALVAVLANRCVRRFGGITGDVLGAGVEITVALVLLNLAVGA